MLRWPYRPDLGPHAGLADERVVGGHGAVAVDADDLAEQAVHALRLHAARGDRAIPQGDEQCAVAREDQAAAEVRARAHRRRLMEDHLERVHARGHSVHEHAARHRGVVLAARPRLRIAPVDQVIGREPRVHRQAEQAALPARIDWRQSCHRRRQRPVGVHDAQSARLLGDEHAAVRQERQRPRRLEILGDRGHLERDVGRPRRGTILASKGRRLVRRVGAAAVDVARPVLGRSGAVHSRQRQRGNRERSRHTRKC